MAALLIGSLHRFARTALAALVLGAAACAAGAQADTEAACPPQAQALTPEQVQLGMRQAQDHGFLWRISRDERVSYLYGTLHIARPQWMFPGAKVMQALRASDSIALELDLLDADIQARMAKAMAADPARRLPDGLAARLSAQHQLACLPEEAMARIAPEIQLAALTTLAARRDGLDPSYAIDAFLARMGRGMRKPVLSLESPEAQVALLKGDPAASLKTLEQGLEQLEGGQTRPLLKRVAQAWADARFDELVRYEAWCECVKTEDDRAAMKRLLDDRNPGLAERIDALHRAGQRVFAAVGSLHMIGPLGLPALMAQRGYLVEHVEFKSAP